MTGRTPPEWHCTRCGRVTVDRVIPSMDPRYATGWCRHGIKDRDPVRVPLVQGDRADGLIAERRFRAAVRRAQRKRLMHHDLSPAEAAALARYEAGSGA